jgi:flagellar biosynthesis GTPase FlhF
MKKIFTITIYILSILIPILLIVNLKIDDENMEFSDHAEQQEIIELADSVIIKIEQIKKKELELESNIESSNNLIKNKNNQIKQLKESKSDQAIDESVAYETVVYEIVESPQPEIIMVKVETINYEKQDSLIMEIEKLKIENSLIKDTISTLRETNIWKKAIKKLEKSNLSQ